MNGPAAPKDPEKKRPYFYIMKDKEIFGAKQEDGSAIHFVYESDGRLINSAQIVGNITDENMLRLLETVEGFGKLVHSIGVSVETDNPKEEMEFIFQMYGKKDLYGGGTNLRCSLTGDGMERRIYLSDYTWTEDDYIPGQIKFIMSAPEKMGKASVRFYLNDGYTAPEEVEEEAVDTKSERYCTMIERSLMNLGNTYRIRKAIEKARAGKEVTLAYIGGSITQGAGATPINTACYAYKSYQLFKSRFAMRDNVKFVKAGVGGTPSELGMLRFDRDVLRDGEKPDIVVVEFAVNDEGDETKGDCYESLVRKILKLDWNPAAGLDQLGILHRREHRGLGSGSPHLLVQLLQRLQIPAGEGTVDPEHLPVAQPEDAAGFLQAGGHPLQREHPAQPCQQHHGAHRTASLNLFSLPLPHHASLLLLCRSPVVFLHYITSAL